MRLIAAVLMIVVLLISVESRAFACSHSAEGLETHCCDSSSEAPSHHDDCDSGACAGCVCACHAPLAPAPVIVSLLVKNTSPLVCADFPCRFPEVYLPLFVPPDIA